MHFTDTCISGVAYTPQIFFTVFMVGGMVVALFSQAPTLP